MDDSHRAFHDSPPAMKSAFMDKSFALIFRIRFAQTARKHLESASYWDDGRRLMRIDEDYIAIPVNNQCAGTLLKKDGLEEKVSFLLTSQCNNDADETSKTGTHQSLLKSSFTESGVKSGLGTQIGSPTCSSSQEKEQSTTLPCVPPNDQAPVSETGSRTPLHSTSNEYTCELSCQQCDVHHSLTPIPGHPPVLWRGKIFKMDAKLVCMELSPSKKTIITTPYDRLKTMVDGWVIEGRIDWKEDLREEIPSHWERHGDLVLLPSSSFTDAAWNHVQDFWSLVAKALNCTRIAKRGRIQCDDFRSPHTEIVLGSDPLVEHKDNGIIYSFDIRYSMFSSGNITEKLRVSSLDCSKETVVDLYSGIGYFTLPYLVHAKAKLLYACEWNPHAVNALQRNLKLNSVNERCIVLEGDNKKVCPVGVADRVNLGLIPSSEQGWSVACAALNPITGGILHIHGNVDSYPIQEWNNPSSRKDDDSCQGVGVSLGESELISGHCRPVTPMRTLDTVLPEDKSCQGEIEIGNTSHSEMVETGNTSHSESVSTVSMDETGNTSNTVSCNKVTETGNTFHSEMGETGNTSHSEMDETGNISHSEMGETGNTAHCKSGSKVSETGTTSHSKMVETGDTSHSKSNGLYPTYLFNKKVSSYCSHVKQAKWFEWGLDTVRQIKGLLYEQHGSDWDVEMVHIEHVKSYAPHIDHMVVDIECRPVS